MPELNKACHYFISVQLCDTFSTMVTSCMQLDFKFLSREEKSVFDDNMIVC